MSSAWTAAERAFRFAAGRFEGTLERTDDGKSLRIVLGGIRIGTLGDLQWTLEDGGAKGATVPVPDVAYIQQPYAVAPFVVNSEVGLRLTAFFRATDDGIDADFRLATVETLASVSLDVVCEWPNNGYRAVAESGNRRRFPGVSAGVVDYGHGKATFLTDVGEHGEFKASSNGGALKLFNQSLEKGVILVGRFALRPSTDPAQIQRDLDAWLDHPTASL